METTNQFKAFIRQPFAFPGGYRQIMVTRDGGVICHKCAKENARLIIEATRRGFDDGWEFSAVDVNWEIEDLYCDHCGGRMPAEYEI